MVFLSVPILIHVCMAFSELLHLVEAALRKKMANRIHRQIKYIYSTCISLTVVSLFFFFFSFVEKKRLTMKVQDVYSMSM